MNARRELDERFADWVDGRLTREQQVQIEAEIAADPELARAAAEYRRLVLATRAPVSVGKLPRDFATAVMAGIPEPTSTPAGGRRFRLLPYVASGLAAAVIVSLLLVVNRVQSRQDAEAPSVESSAKAPVALDSFESPLVDSQAAGKAVRKSDFGRAGETAGEKPAGQSVVPSKSLGGGGGGVSKGGEPAPGAPAAPVELVKPSEGLDDENGVDKRKAESKGQRGSDFPSLERSAGQAGRLGGPPPGDPRGALEPRSGERSQGGTESDEKKRADKNRQADRTAENRTAENKTLENKTLENKTAEKLSGGAWLEDFVAGNPGAKLPAPDSGSKDAKELKTESQDGAGYRAELGQVRGGLLGESVLGALVLTVSFDENQTGVVDQLRAGGKFADSDAEGRPTGATKEVPNDRSKGNAATGSRGVKGDPGLARDAEQLFFMSLSAASATGNRVPPTLQLWSRPAPMAGATPEQLKRVSSDQDPVTEAAPRVWRRDETEFLAKTGSRPGAVERRDHLLGMRGDREQVQAFVREVMDLAKQLQGKVSVDREQSYQFAPGPVADSEAHTGAATAPTVRPPASGSVALPEEALRQANQQLRGQSAASRPTDEMTVWVRVLVGR